MAQTSTLKTLLVPHTTYVKSLVTRYVKTLLYTGQIMILINRQKIHTSFASRYDHVQDFSDEPDLYNFLDTCLALRGLFLAYKVS